MLLVFVLHVLVFHFNTSVIYADFTPYSHYLDIVLEIFIIVDVIVNLQTAYIDEELRKVVFETKLVLINYCSTKLCFHVASAIPLHCITFLRYGKDFQCPLCKLNNFIMTLKIISILHLARTFEYSAYMARDRRSHTLTFVVRLVRIGMLAFLTTLMFRDLSDSIQVTVMTHMKDIKPFTRPIKMIRVKFAYSKPLDFYLYIAHDISRICKSSFMYTFHIPSTLYTENVTITLIIYFISNMFYLWMFFEVYSYTSRVKYPEDTLIWAETMALNLVRSRHLSDHVAQRIHEYFDFNMAKMRVFDMKNRHYNSLPAVLQKEAFHYRYSDYFKRIPYFAEWPKNLIRDLVMLLREEIYLKNSLVAEVSIYEALL